MKVCPDDRKKLVYFLKIFYSHFGKERFTIFHLVRYIKLRNNMDKDSWIAVSGGTGMGKSYLDLMIMVLFGKRMDLEKNICYNPDGLEVSKKFSVLRKNILMVDEAARDFRSVNWQSKSQQKMTMQALTDRFYNNVVLLNLPNFKELNKSMREGTVLFRLYCLYRSKNYARIVVHARSRNWRSEDPWGEKIGNDMHEKHEKRYGSPNDKELLEIERKLPCYVMDFIVPNIGIILPNITEEYERLKLESRKETQGDEPDNKESNKVKKLEEMNKKVKMAKELYDALPGSVTERKRKAADIMTMSYQTYTNYLKKEIITLKEAEKEPELLKEPKETKRRKKPEVEDHIPSEGDNLTSDTKESSGYVADSYTLS